MLDARNYLVRLPVAWDWTDAHRTTQRLIRLTRRCSVSPNDLATYPAPRAPLPPSSRPSRRFNTRIGARRWRAAVRGTRAVGSAWATTRRRTTFDWASAITRSTETVWTYVPAVLWDWADSDAAVVERARILSALSQGRAVNICISLGRVDCHTLLWTLPTPENQSPAAQKRFPISLFHQETFQRYSDRRWDLGTPLRSICRRKDVHKRSPRRRSRILLDDQLRAPVLF